MSFTTDEALESTGIPGTNVRLDESLAKYVNWTELPDSLLLHIFAFLSPKEVLNAGEICRNWHRLCKDELLWKSFLQQTLYNAANRNKIELPDSSSSWFAEFQRIHIETPFAESQVLEEHTDEVLHVAFSHDGQLLASSSKDCSVILWRVDNFNRVSISQKIKFKKYNWEYTQFCEFNESDTLLLVSGVNSRQQRRGEILIYKLQGSSEASLVSNAGTINVPYALFGAWLIERYYISGTLKVSQHGQQVFSQLWANHVAELPEDQTNQSKSKLAVVANHHGWCVTIPRVARPNMYTSSQSTHASTTTLQRDDHVCLIFTCGTVTNAEPHQIMVKWLPCDLNSSVGLKSLVAERKIFSNNEHEEQQGGMPSNGYGSCSRSDHCIETNAHIIGMSLSPDHQYLYVNCRQFQQKDGQFGSTLNPLEISNDITLHVYSLSTYELVSVHVGHQAYSKHDYCFFIYLDVADKLVASGAEDHCAHVWDRHFGAKLATLKGHSDVVNCVAFNPVNQEMLVSASDDHTIRVWNSKQLSKLNHKTEQKK